MVCASERNFYASPQNPFNFARSGALGCSVGFGERGEGKRPAIKLFAGTSPWAPRLGDRSKIDIMGKSTASRTTRTMA